MQVLEQVTGIQEGSAINLINNKRKKTGQGFLEALTAVITAMNKSSTAQAPVTEKKIPALLDSDKVKTPQNKAILTQKSLNADNLGLSVEAKKAEASKQTIKSKENTVKENEAIQEKKSESNDSKHKTQNFYTDINSDVLAIKNKAESGKPVEAAILKAGKTAIDAKEATEKYQKKEKQANSKNIFEVEQAIDYQDKKGKKISVIDLKLNNKVEDRIQASKRKVSDNALNKSMLSQDSSTQKEAERTNAVGSNSINSDAATSFIKADKYDSWYGKADASAIKNSQNASSFTESLTARLKEGAGELVRSAQIVLKDGDSGVIRLRLEPESLGGVKIELKMTEKQISGKIIVESDIAGEAFRASIDALKDSFAEAGLTTKSLEVEVRNGMANGSEAKEGSDSDKADQYWSQSIEKLDKAVPVAIRGQAIGLLNIIV